MKDAAEPSTATDGEGKTAAATATQRGTGGSGGRGSGPGDASQFGWYSRMLHDRFFGAWVQPTTVVTTGVKMSALVKLRIEKDGRVSNFAIVRSSGNVVVDESVEAVARRVTQVDALPPGLSDGPYDVSINFELRSE
jgi:TonB family protein